MPAAGGVKIKKSFRNVPEKSIWELEGMGGTEALSTSNPPPARGVVATRAIETRPFGVNGVSLTRERLEEGSAEEKAPETEEGDEDSEGRSEDEGTEGSGREVEERAGDGVKGGVKELTAWEKLMQKAAAGQEDDNFIDEEVGGLAGFGAVGKLPGNPGTAKRTEDVGGLEGSGAVGKSPVDPGTARLTDASEERPPVGGGLERGEVRGKKEGAKQRANDSVPAAGEGVTKAEPVGLSDWERLMQKAAGAWDDEESLDGLETGEFEQASGDGESDAGEGDDLNGDELEGGPDDSKEERPGMGIEGLDGDQELGAKEESTRVEELDLEASDGVPDNVAAAGEGASEDGALAERSGGAEFGEEVLSEDDVMEDADVMDGGGTEGEADDDLEGDEVGDGEEGTTDSGGSVDEEGSEEADDSGEESFESEEERSGSVSEEEEEVSEAEGQEWQGGVSEDEERSSGEGAGVSDGKERDSVGPEAESGGAKTESGEAAAESGDDGGASDGEAEADTDGGISEEVPDDDENLDEGGGNVKDDMDSGREQPLWESASELQQPVKALDDAEAEFETAPVEEVDAEVPAAGVSPEPAGADGTDSAAADGTAAGRTAEEEEIARQLAEERRKQLGILGAMFPDDARFFRCVGISYLTFFYICSPLTRCVVGPTLWAPV